MFNVVEHLIINLNRIVKPASLWVFCKRWALWILVVWLMALYTVKDNITIFKVFLKTLEIWIYLIYIVQWYVIMAFFFK